MQDKSAEILALFKNSDGPLEALWHFRKWCRPSGHLVKSNSPDLFFDTKYSTCLKRFKVDSFTSQGCLVIRVEPILEAVWRFSTCSWFVVRRYNFAVLGCACHSEQNHSTAIHRFTRNVGKLEREGNGVFPQGRCHKIFIHIYEIIYWSDMLFSEYRYRILVILITEARIILDFPLTSIFSQNNILFINSEVDFPQPLRLVMSNQYPICVP